MVNDHSPFYTLKIRWRFQKFSTYFLPLYKVQYWRKIFCLTQPPKQNLPHSYRPSWTSSAFGAYLSLLLPIPNITFRFPCPHFIFVTSSHHALLKPHIFVPRPCETVTIPAGSALGFHCWERFAMFDILSTVYYCWNGILFNL